MKRTILTLTVLLGSLFATPVLADPVCDADTFSGEQSCVYGRKSIGLPGIGNQIHTKDGQMTFVRLISQIGGDPTDIEGVLFRVNDARTISLPAANLNRPAVNCAGSLCTWSWNVAARMPGPVLAELAAAKKLIIGFRGQGRTIEESELRRGGQIFQKFQADIQEHEPEILLGQGEAFLLQGSELVPYVSP